MRISTFLIILMVLLISAKIKTDTRYVFEIEDNIAEYMRDLVKQ